VSILINRQKRLKIRFVRERDYEGVVRRRREKIEKNAN